MKQIRIALFISLAALVCACGKTASEVPVRASDIFIPESASLVGFLDVSKVLSIEQLKETQDSIRQQFGEAFEDIKLEEIKEVSFWGSYDEAEKTQAAWCAALESKIIANVPEFFERNFEARPAVEGIPTFRLKEDTAIHAAAIDAWILVGTGQGVAKSILAAKGANFPESPRGKEFRQMMGKTQGGLFTMTFIPTPDLKKKLQEQNPSQDMEPFTRDFTGGSIAADYAKNKLSLTLALDSSESAVKTAAEDIMKKKEEYKSMISFTASFVGQENVPLVEKTYNSFTAKASGRTLRLSLELSDTILEVIAKTITTLSQISPGLIEELEGASEIITD